MLIPMLICRDAGAEIDFCKKAFGAEELSRKTAEDGAVFHATLAINQALLMVHDITPHLGSEPPGLDGTSPVVLYLYGDEADSVIDKAVSAGARILMAASNQPWGHRVGRILDPAGHVWNIASSL